MRIWDPATGDLLRPPTGHQGWVNAVCAFTVDGATCLATASDDNTVRIWDPATEAAALVIPARDKAQSVVYADGLLFIGLTTGLLAIRLGAGPPRQSSGGTAP